MVSQSPYGAKPSATFSAGSGRCLSTLNRRNPLTGLNLLQPVLNDSDDLLGYESQSPYGAKPSATSTWTRGVLRCSLGVAIPLRG